MKKQAKPKKAKIEKPRQLQLIYDETLEKKQKAKELREMYRDALTNADEYVKIDNEIKELSEKRKELKEKVQNQLGRAWEQLEDIKCDIDKDKVRMTDVALNDLMKGITVAVKDQYANEYEPVWNVRFVKIK